MSNRLRTPIFAFFAIISLLLFFGTSCSPVDRSDEQPFAPTVLITGCEVVGEQCLLRGEVTASPNSDLLRCGFRYGSDSKEKEVTCDAAPPLFQAVTDSLEPGLYYAVSFAANGVGEGESADTLWFEI